MYSVNIRKSCSWKDAKTYEELTHKNSVGSWDAIFACPPVARNTKKKTAATNTR